MHNFIGIPLLEIENEKEQLSDGNNTLASLDSKGEEELSQERAREIERQCQRDVILTQCFEGLYGSSCEKIVPNSNVEKFR